MNTTLRNAILTLMIAGSANATDLEKAQALAAHGLRAEAKALFIELLFQQKPSAKEQATCLYWLGNISFEEGNYAAAGDDWRRLVDTYPDAPEAGEVTERFGLLKDALSQASDKQKISSVAAAIISNGDFWSHSENKFSIDSSWLPPVEMASEWYDRVITGFPGTPEAELAFQRKMFALIGWREGGRDGDAHGAKGNSAKYLPMILKTFGEFEAAFPESPYLQGFRYQIAQIYWSMRDFKETRAWLKKVIDGESGRVGGESFYVRLAKWRLQKVEF